MTSLFSDLHAFFALDRVTGLAMSQDGSRLVATVSHLNKAGNEYKSTLWEVDPAGNKPARRITHSEEGESAPVFDNAGNLLFLSARKNADAPQEKVPTTLWRLPAGAGESEPIFSRPGGMGLLLCAKKSDRTIISGNQIRGAADEEQEIELRTKRTGAKVSAIMHDTFPTQFWDHDVNAETKQLFELVPSLDKPQPAKNTEENSEDSFPYTVRQILNAENHLFQTQQYLSPDGSTIVSSWYTVTTGGEANQLLALIDVETGTKKFIEPLQNGWELIAGPFNEDGSKVALINSRKATLDLAPTQHLAILDVATGTVNPLAKDWDRWGSSLGFSPDGSTLYLSADNDGGTSLYGVDLASEEVTQITTDQAAYTEVMIDPAGQYLYALRASVEQPNQVVRIDLSSLEVAVLDSPAQQLELPGRVERISTTVADGTDIASYLFLPEQSQTPAPLLLWPHGGPISSWNTWSWRWNPWLFVDKGYAVLLPDPALSTGYGQHMIDRGHGEWGGTPYTDILSAHEQVLARADIDETRTALMGGSYGGYIANWAAGHTDQFKAIISHAGLWNLAQAHSTADMGYFWKRDFDDQRTATYSPDQFVGNIKTPILIIHGGKDYRVPISQGQRMYFDLIRNSQLPMDEHGNTDHRYLYFPNENHWILKPAHARVWNQSCFAFLAKHVLGAHEDFSEEIGIIEE